MMKVLRVVLVVALLLLLPGCNGCSNKWFKVEITGPERMQFIGQVLVTKANGSTESQSLDGWAPQEMYYEGVAVSVIIQKDTDASGSLTVSLLKDDKIIATSKATGAYGVAKISGH